MPWYATPTGLSQTNTVNRNAVAIGLVDRAVNRTLPQFRDRIFNPISMRGHRGGDAGAQHDDDRYGWNFVRNDNNTWTESDGSDFYGHGNRVAGVILAPRNGIFFGAFPNVFVIPAVVYEESAPQLGHVVEALCYFLSLRHRGLNLAAINLSMGFCSSDLNCLEREGLEEIVRALGDAGVLIVATAANRGQGCHVTRPPCPNELSTDSQNCRDHDICGFLPATLGMSNVLSVTTAVDGFFYTGSQPCTVVPGPQPCCRATCNTPGWGAQSIDLHAPGMNVPSVTWLGELTLTNGNSFAAPIVSAIAAMVVDANPDVRGAALRQRILRATVPLQHCTYEGRTCSGGIINAPRSIAGEGDSGARCSIGR